VSIYKLYAQCIYVAFLVIGLEMDLGPFFLTQPNPLTIKL